MKVIMADNWNYFESFYKSSKIPPTSISSEVIKNIYQYLNNINNNAIEEQVNKIQQFPGQSEDDFHRFISELRDVYKLTIQIFCDSGKSIFGRDETIFDENNFPDKINRIIFDNETMYRVRYNQNPPYRIKFELDFTKPRIFELSTNPSYATFNSSILELSGLNETTIIGAERKVLSILESKHKYTAFLHKSNIYDALLWFLLLPFIFYNLYKFDNLISNTLSQTTSIFKTSLYVYIFLISLMLIRILFNYARWLFPYMELKTKIKRGALGHRLFFSGLLLAFLFSGLYDLIMFILGKLL
jgi:hypothetical protein